MRNAVLVALLGALALPAQAQTTVAGATPGSFRVTESGAAEYRVPIRVPPGIAGMEPRLALVYNSQAGNGLLGVGWSLEGLSAIARCPRTMAQDGVRGAVNYDANDRYCLDGQRLIAIAGSYGADGTEYRTERESFSKIVSFGQAGSGPAWFKVWTKSGQILEYGSTADARIEAPARASVRVWALNRIADAKGNYLTVSYIEDAANAEFYPRRLEYPGDAAAGAQPAAAVEFAYLARPDHVATFSAGSASRLAVRLERINISVGASPIAEYRLAYGLGPAAERSRLSSITECAPSACLPPTVLGWANGGGGATTSTSTVQTYGGPSGWRSAFAIYSGDFDGDGISDLYLVSDGDLHFCRGGPGLITSAACTRTYSGSSGWRSAFNIYVGDFDGDGISDLYLVSDGDLHFCRGGPGLITSAACTRTYSGPSGWKSAFNIYVGDFDGDGISDLYLVSDGDLHFCRGGAGLTTGAACTRTYSGASAWKSTFNIHVGDFDGDGISDLYLVSDGDLHFCRGGAGLTTSAACTRTYSGASVWKSVFNIYSGDFDGDGISDLYLVSDGDLHFCRGGPGGGLISAGSCTRTYSGASGWKSTFNIYPGDFDGDGMADLYLVSDNDLHFCRGRGLATSAACTRTYSGPSGWKSVFNIYAGDFNGDGTTDLYLVSDGALHFLPGGNGRPDLVTSISRDVGQAVNLAYRPLTDASVYSKDSGANAAAYPAMDLQSPLYAVSTAALSDGVGGTTLRRHRYGGLKAELSGRGLLGLRWHESTLAASGETVRVELRQDWPYVGLPALVRKTQISGALLGQVTNQYDCRNPLNGSACAITAGNRYFPFVWRSVESGADLNGAALPTVTTETQYDGSGNPTRITVSAADGYSKTTTNAYAPPDTANWRLGRLTRSTVESMSP
jgi:hypothetical protein